MHPTTVFNNSKILEACFLTPKEAIHVINNIRYVNTSNCPASTYFVKT